MGPQAHSDEASPPSSRPESVASGSNVSFSVQPDSSFNSRRQQGQRSLDASPAPVDKFAHTRGKRKRTSREDFGILESEYQREPRPDKATRLEIVERVSLTEKEVQIWFQNRRQMTRRKCRTWQPNEITSIIRLSQDTTEENECTRDANNDGFVASSQSSSLGVPASQETTDTKMSALSSQEIEEAETASKVTNHTAILAEGDRVKSIAESIANREDADTEITTTSSQSEPTSKGTVAETEGAIRESTTPVLTANVDNEKNARPIVMPAEDTLADIMSATLSKPLERKPSLKRTSSSFRLSTSLDGKAQVVMGGNTPSPPKRQRATPLQRSQSLATGTAHMGAEVTTPAIDSGEQYPAWRTHRAHGRSRDAATWEFYCDSDARNALSKSAEHEQKGSALGLISLIRSGSANRKPLTPVSKQNSRSTKPEAQNGEKPKLARAISSVARLQTTSGNASLASAYKAKKQQPCSSQFELWEEPNNSESDKENQDPGKLNRVVRVRKEGRAGGHSRPSSAQHPPSPKVPFGASPRRAALQENTSIMSHSSSIMSHSSSLGVLMERDRISSSASARKQKRPTTATKLIIVDENNDKENAAYGGGNEDHEEDFDPELSVILSGNRNRNGGHRYNMTSTTSSLLMSSSSSSLSYSTTKTKTIAAAVAAVSSSSPPRVEADLDAVQNLLSLSQGAWR